MPPTLFAAQRNPSRRTVSFTLELAAPASVRVQVFDVLGREMWSDESVRPAGRSELRWALTDRAGARVPNGVYRARVSRGGEELALRFVVME